MRPGDRLAIRGRAGRPAATSAAGFSPSSVGAVPGRRDRRLRPLSEVAGRRRRSGAAAADDRGGERARPEHGARGEPGCAGPCRPAAGPRHRGHRRRGGGRGRAGAGGRRAHAARAAARRPDPGGARGGGRRAGGELLERRSPGRAGRLRHGDNAGAVGRRGVQLCPGAGRAARRRRLRPGTARRGDGDGRAAARRGGRPRADRGAHARERRAGPGLDAALGERRHPSGRRVPAGRRKRPDRLRRGALRRRTPVDGRGAVGRPRRRGGPWPRGIVVRRAAARPASCPSSTPFRPASASRGASSRHWVTTRR